MVGTGGGGGGRRRGGGPGERALAEMVEGGAMELPRLNRSAVTRASSLEALIAEEAEEDVG